jgi:F-type H+-transporting ATPase subunit epsilon
MATETHSAGHITLSIVTPTGRVADVQTSDVIAPSVMGEFDVLPGHVPILAALKAGVLSWSEGGTRHVLAVDKGFLQVGADNKVIVLVEAALSPAKIDVAEAQADAQAASETMKAGGGDAVAMQLAQEKLGWAQARLAAVGRAAARSDAH